MNGRIADSASLRHARVYIARAVEISTMVRGPHAAQASDAADRHWPQVSHAIEWLVPNAGQPETDELLVQLLREASDLLNLRCPSNVRVTWLERLRGIPGPGIATALTVSVSVTLGNYYRNLGRLDESRLVLRRAAALAKQCGDVFEMMRTLAFHGFTSQQRKQHRRALVQYRAALDIAHDTEDDWWKCSTELMAARCRHILGQDASGPTARAAAIAERLQDPRLLANVHQVMAMLTMDDEDPEPSIAHLSRSIMRIPAHPDHPIRPNVIAESGDRDRPIRAS